jgi:aminoglycoside phosphotransferase (APT) family kinase protein
MAVDGIDDAAVSAWLGERTSVTPPLAYEVIAGGRSNLTYRVSDAEGRKWVLRRPPLHSVLASAHDVGREHRLMHALQDSAVPVPPLVGLESDPEVNGAPFYVMEFVDGHVIRSVGDAEEALAPDVRRDTARGLVQTLVDLHAVDIDAVGLGDLARREEYLARQLRRWYGQFQKGDSRDLPLVGQLHDRLVADIPEQHGTAIVHGDYRLDNVIVDDRGAIKAVLDWELCTLGDPLADLGLLVVYWTPPSATELPLIPAAGAIPGFPDSDEIVSWYAQLSGRDVSELPYYVAFGLWKLAIILEGVYSRFSAGAYGQTDDSHKVFARLVEELLDQADEQAATVGR